jgi:hypothetical protein
MLNASGLIPSINAPAVFLGSSLYRERSCFHPPPPYNLLPRTKRYQKLCPGVFGSPQKPYPFKNETKTGLCSTSSATLNCTEYTALSLHAASPSRHDRIKIITHSNNTEKIQSDILPHLTSQNRDTRSFLANAIDTPQYFHYTKRP